MYALRAASIRRVPATATRSFVSSARLQSGGSHVSNNDPEVLEREKQRNLKGDHDHTSAPHKKSAPGWNEQLASVSEAAVKADQSHDPSMTPEQLTKVTIEQITKRHAEGEPADTLTMKKTSEVLEVNHPDSGERSHQEARYEKEEVEGPLGGMGRNSQKVERDEVQGPLKDAGKT